MAKMTDTIMSSETRLTLERIKMYVAKNIGSSMADSMEVSKQVMMGVEGMVYQLRVDVLASKLADDKYKAHFYYKVPATWFQHLKKTHAPKWFNRRYPVQYTDKKMTKTVQFKRYETYPQANIAVPKDQRTIEMLGLTRPIRDVIEEY